jgi:2-amino-4-hydroxy-6-hydroxymethyldihydropteridine diphosphokinase
VWLGLGTNLGDRAANLARAIVALEQLLGTLALSGVYETEPIGYTDQPVFWNMAVRAGSTLTPGALLAALKQLEPQLGRTASFRMGPRAIDIDILLHDTECVDTDSLTIPHPGLLERAFALLPVLELDPDLRDPRSGRELADHRAGTAGVRRLGDAAELLPVDQWRNA